MLCDAITAVLSIVLALAGFLVHPAHVECPHGWWLPEGAPDGLAKCRPLPTGDAVRNAKGFLVDNGMDPPGEFRVQLDCHGDRVRQNGKSAWCAP